jgi:hypothetical protein
MTIGVTILVEMTIGVTILVEFVVATIKFLMMEW